MATGDDFINEVESLDIFDNIQLIKDDSETRGTLNWMEISGPEKNNVNECSKESPNKLIAKKVEFNLTLNDHVKDVVATSPPSTSSFSTNSYIDRIIGKYKKLEDSLSGQQDFQSDDEISNKNVKTVKIMGSIQLGIHHSVGSLASKPERDLLMNDFMIVESTTFAADGSNLTPAHNYSQFIFKTYAPTAFRYFRELFGIPTDDYLLSFCKNPLYELPNPGSSGSIFYVTKDDKFIMKTMQNRECEFLQKLLPGYYMNLHQNPKTLLPKFFGLYGYKCEKKKIRLVAMNNVLPSHVRLHQKFDLKGSTYKRKANKKSKTESETTTYKDLDFIYHYQDGLYLEDEIYQEVMKTIKRDCRVLESFKIMDYSLLLGIRNLDKDKPFGIDKDDLNSKDNDNKKQQQNNSGNENNSGIITNTTDDKDLTNASSSDANLKQNGNKHIAVHLQGGIPAKTSKGDKLLIFIGIIDILQSYRFIKKLEHSWKSIIHNGDTVSVHNPRFYSCRFQKFLIDQVFKKLPSTLKPKNRSSSKMKTYSLSRPD